MGCHASCLSYVELFAPLRGSSTSLVVTQGLHHNAACVCDDGQKGGCIISYKDSAVRFFIAESVSLYSKKKGVMVRRGLHHFLTQYKGFMF